MSHCPKIHLTQGLAAALLAFSFVLPTPPKKEKKKKSFKSLSQEYV